MRIRATLDAPAAHAEPATRGAPPGRAAMLGTDMALTEVDAVLAGGAAALTTAALTPLAARLARRVGAVDAPRERGLAVRETPLLGGFAILAGVLVAAWAW